MMFFLDLEASSLEGGYPIEVGVVRADGSNRSWLIRPDEGWLDHRLWSAEAESLHGLAQDFLIEHGLPAAQVAAEVAGLLADQAAYSDAPAYDGRWLDDLMHAGKIQNSIHLQPVMQAYGLACRPLLEGRIDPKERGMASATAMHLIAKAEHQEERRPRTRHRALPDADSLWRTWMLVGQFVADWVAERGA